MLDSISGYFIYGVGFAVIALASFGLLVKVFRELFGWVLASVVAMTKEFISAREQF